MAEGLEKAVFVEVEKEVVVVAELLKHGAIEKLHLVVFEQRQRRVRCSGCNRCRKCRRTA